MKQLDQSPVDAGVELFPIRTVSTLTGVNSITLRAWERRYGLIQPIRTPTGHRLYRREEIDLIHRVVALLEKGMSISQARRALERSAAAPAADESPPGQLWARLRERMLTAIIRFDEEGLDEIYNEALGACAVGQVMQRLLLPLQDTLARRLQHGEGSLAEERFYAVYLRNKLGARLHHRAARRSAPRFLGACLPGEHRDTGLLLFALAAHEAGLCPVLLGAHTPVEELAFAVRRGRCQAAVLYGAHAPEPRLLAEQLPRLCAAIGVPVFVGDAVSIRYRDAVVAAGAIPLGTDLAAATRRLAEGLNAAPLPG